MKWFEKKLIKFNILFNKVFIFIIRILNIYWIKILLYIYIIGIYNVIIVIVVLI